MSQYKVLPSYTDLTSFPDIHQLPLIFSAGVGEEDSGLQVGTSNTCTDDKARQRSSEPILSFFTLYTI